MDCFVFFPTCIKSFHLRHLHFSEERQPNPPHNSVVANFFRYATTRTPKRSTVSSTTNWNHLAETCGLRFSVKACTKNTCHICRNQMFHAWIFKLFHLSRSLIEVLTSQVLGDDISWYLNSINLLIHWGYGKGQCQYFWMLWLRQIWVSCNNKKSTSTVYIYT